MTIRKDCDYCKIATHNTKTHFSRGSESAEYACALPEKERKLRICADCDLQNHLYASEL